LSVRSRVDVLEKRCVEGKTYAKAEALRVEVSATLFVGHKEMTKRCGSIPR